MQPIVAKVVYATSASTFFAGRTGPSVASWWKNGVIFVRSQINGTDDTIRAYRFDVYVCAEARQVRSFYRHPHTMLAYQIRKDNCVHLSTM